VLYIIDSTRASVGKRQGLSPARGSATFNNWYKIDDSTKTFLNWYYIYLQQIADLKSDVIAAGDSDCFALAGNDIKSLLHSLGVKSNPEANK
jgi:hypothetical protein